MDPFTIMQGVSAIAAPIAGLFAKPSATQMAANDLAWRNYYDQQRNNALMYQLAKRSMDAQLGDTVNARGGRTHYDPVTHTWSVIPSQRESDLINASDTEQLRRLTTDAAMRRQGLVANSQRRVQEGSTADALLNEFKQQPVDQTQYITSLLRERGRRAVNEGFESAENNVARQAIRAGSNFSTLVGDAASDKGKAMADAETEAILRGLESGQSLSANRRNNTANLYNQFASRASNFEDVPFQPSNVDDNLLSTLVSRASGVPKAAEAGLGALAAGGRNATGAALGLGDLARYTSNDYSTANTIGAIGAALPGFASMFKNRQNGNTNNTGSLFDSGGYQSRNPLQRIMGF